MLKVLVVVLSQRLILLFSLGHICCFSHGGGGRDGESDNVDGIEVLVLVMFSDGSGDSR